MASGVVYGTDQVEIKVSDMDRSNTCITVKSDWCGQFESVEVNRKSGVITIHMKQNPNEKKFDEDGEFILGEKDCGVVTTIK